MDNKRFFLATLLSVVLLFAFEYFTPKKEETHNTTQQVKQEQTKLTTQKGESSSTQVVAEAGPDIRIPINANQVKGSLNLKGALLDDLVLKNYRETIQKDSPLVRVLSAPKTKDANYVQTGWVNAEHDTTKLPDINSVWKTDQKELTPEHPITMTWDNGQGVKFEKTISIDKNYMFKFEQKVINASDKPVSVFFYGRVSRGYTPKELSGYLVHDGPIGIVDKRLEQYSYETIRKDSKAPSDISWSKNTTGGWAGITDKYWLTAIVPQQDKNVSVVYGFTPDADQTANINTDGVEKGTYQVGFTSRQPMVAAPGETVSTFGHVFSGAKVVELLNQYEKEYHIPDFWKAVDFGWFAFLTYPIFIVLDWLNNFWGNFGLALLTFTLIVKGVFYPLASKQFHSMGKMKALQPKMKEIREKYKDDQQLMNQQMMGLYKEQGVNPASGCLPILIQIPIFWCLYKDLYVTIEMRHAPFFGWIRDLSAPDPTNIFNLFGLLPFDPAAISPFLHVGIWPLIFGLTMFLQQKLNPAVLDPIQKRMFQFMPIIFTVVLATQPAGLVIYYSWNNTLTALQQLVIQKRMDAKAKKAKTKAAKG
ncbi:membrane protein insertase YidC [Commensalibacter communis]|uniref:Membrane protein insertase YidC n=1 Tax=Commensalibacter communis TaxID=2972786 RepID=A0A9W4X9Z3_9PROT|nr:membrane protein insertase YidC [Commensalibacter communis]CAI3923842.1 Membrane protein insertase Oxa1/YidC/SpoIIIJ (YidC) (PDB:3WO6) [Commensalibacter communis]CAI3924356.1 Membrane protein insertase Oxa1/YidC/SpoIIIJ (YidC) (PDB:3WO6) [Commensalibacter communis]CAI3946137.1 Membrane protein insertase Oxa1/YidC/SpoIIIJ (YidC) (PDB:3WO6) [Commensalibacter communis]CAI3946294.1 Membrane protein insertase Oxa1/YidC/SpoIIIJ (YidC) (PDB:3WO6) [Commensalibacter communis]CAI3948546.1 Membrane pr